MFECNVTGTDLHLQNEYSIVTGMPDQCVMIHTLSGNPGIRYGEVISSHVLTTS